MIVSELKYNQHALNVNRPTVSKTDGILNLVARLGFIALNIPVIRGFSERVSAFTWLFVWFVYIRQISIHFTATL